MTYTKNTGRSYTQSWLSQGFTLIELLVVVLIIGILAAIAVPQYKIAVMKSRLATFRAQMIQVLHAQKLFYLSNGRHPNNTGSFFQELSSTGGDLTNSCKWWSDNWYRCGDWGAGAGNIRSPLGSEFAYCPSAKTVRECQTTADFIYWITDKQEACEGLTDFGKKLCKTFQK